MTFKVAREGVQFLPRYLRVILIERNIALYADARGQQFVHYFRDTVQVVSENDKNSDADL